MSIMKILTNGGYNVQYYSGRRMYGKMCPSITIDDPNELVQALVIEIIETAVDDESFDYYNAVDRLFRYKTDQMGPSKVIYWPEEGVKE